jgi:hypothetical protein
LSQLNFPASIPAIRSFPAETSRNLDLQLRSLRKTETVNGVRPCVNAAYQAMKEEIGASVASAHNKQLWELAEAVNPEAFKKHPRSPNKPPPERIKDPNTPHVSTANILRQGKEIGTTLKGVRQVLNPAF